MDPEWRQTIRLSMVIIGWGMVGVNLAVGYFAGAVLLSLVAGWATWTYLKRRRNDRWQ